jgi:glycosyltransferase involved in cell wall biosynthesis
VRTATSTHPDREGSPARLILVGPLPPPYYGQSVSFRMLVDEVARTGVPHVVVDLAHGEAAGEKMGVLTRHRVADYASILRRFFAAAAGPRGTVYLTIAQSRSGFMRDWVMIRYARLFGHRVVLHLKGGNYDNFYAAQPAWVRALVRWTLRSADRVLVLGERLRAMFDFEPAVAGRIHVVPNGLPDERERAGVAKTLPAPGEGPVRLLFLSNLVESKGWLDVLEALRLLRDRLGERVRCDFHGRFLTYAPDDVRVTSEEQARELFERFVAEHGLERVARYRGVAAGEEKRRALEEAHLFVLPTRYANEGQPVSIIEAMAYGNVVISTDYRAIPDMVDDGVTGVLVPWAAPAAIADAVEALVRDPARFAEMSRAALTRFRARFTRRGHLDTLLPHLLEGVVPAPGPAAGHGAPPAAARAGAAGLAQPHPERTRT